ncbi:MAG: hypothetical protein CSA95_06105 [Bacteroidetes bacterium]|nr:MAG: hypothetical protein CSA95_06105 [Bacteroidota bacterium]PIE88269.1 MAG: hypothetical protein CSA04_02785 [Bacteroidota bacterium]
MTTSQENPVASKGVLEMFTVAVEFCLFVEKASNYKRADILTYMQKMIPLLYLKGALLPTILPEYPEANERYVTEMQWEDIFTPLREKFGSLDNFPYYNYQEMDMEPPSKGSLAENLADIYQDLKDFTLLYQKNSLAAKENAVAELKRFFTSHWGSRLVETLHYIHHVLTEEE